MVTRDVLCLTIDIFPDEVGFFYYIIRLGVYIGVAHGNRYLPRSSKENSLVIIIVGNVSVTR